MKKILVLILFLFIQISFGQITRDLGDFNAVKVFDQLQVKLISSSENKVIITGNRENEVEIINKNGELKLRMPFPKLLSGDAIKIELYYKKLNSIQANEGSIISSDEIFKQTSLAITTGEGAQIILELDVEKATIKAVTGGIIELSGRATNQNVMITSGGNYNGVELQTTQTTVAVSAGGEAEVFATLLVDAKVTAGGSIDIYGKPSQINQKTVLGGTIREK